MTDRTKIILLEIACLLVIAGAIAVIAIPKLDDLKRRDTASGLVADLEGLRTAVFSFYSDSAYFPDEVPNNAIPPALERYLPRGFTTTRPYGTIVYKNWPGGAPTTTTTDSSAVAALVAPPQPAAGASGGEEIARAPNIIGAVIIANDPKVVGTAAAQSPRIARFVVGNRYTFLLFGS
jgi:hypothetical protein